MQTRNDSRYKQDLKEEEALWNKTAKVELTKMPPDYKSYKETDPYKIYRNKYVMKMLQNINRGDRILELGCYNGWFTLEMARKNANIDAHDISKGAIEIAKKYYLRRRKQ